MSSPIRGLSLIQRMPATEEIDVQATLHVLAKELLAWKDEERRIRNNRRYRAVIRRVFKKHGVQFIPSAALVVLSLKEMNVHYNHYARIHKELGQHISFNRKGYLRAVTGQGIELVKP